MLGCHFQDFYFSSFSNCVSVGFANKCSLILRYTFFFILPNHSHQQTPSSSSLFRVNWYSRPVDFPKQKIPSHDFLLLFAKFILLLKWNKRNPPVESSKGTPFRDTQRIGAPPKGHRTPLEAAYRHLQRTSSHDFLLKVESMKDTY